MEIVITAVLSLYRTTSLFIEVKDDDNFGSDLIAAIAATHGHPLVLG